MLQHMSETHDERVRWDLTDKMARFFDSHLLAPLLNHLVEKKIYDESEVQFLKARLQSNNNNLSESHETSHVNENSAHSIAKQAYERGDYAECLIILNQLISTAPSNTTALWGKLSCCFLLENWDEASDTLSKLRDSIEYQQYPNFLLQLQNRVWLLHYALFLYANSVEQRLQFFDCFSNERYLLVVQTLCPYIRRYFVVSLVLRKRRNYKDTQRFLDVDLVYYSDPIVEFWKALYNQYDFDLAQKKLIACQTVFEHDYFLRSCWTEFYELAHDLILENFCSVHSRLDLNFLLHRLDKNLEDTDKWISSLSHPLKLELKIENDYVLIDQHKPSVYQQILDKSRNLSSRPFFSNSAAATSLDD